MSAAGVITRPASDQKAAKVRSGHDPGQVIRSADGLTQSRRHEIFEWGCRIQKSTDSG